MQCVVLPSFSYQMKLWSLSIPGLLAAWYIHCIIEQSPARLWWAFESHINLISFTAALCGVSLTYLSPAFSVITMAFWYGRWFWWPLLDGGIASALFCASPEAKVEAAIKRYGKRNLLISCQVESKMYTCNMLILRWRNKQKNHARC